MIDTTGWEKSKSGYEKKIGPHWFRIWGFAGKFHLGWPGNGQVSATRPTLRECQILAHDTARLWAGEIE